MDRNSKALIKAKAKAKVRSSIDKLKELVKLGFEIKY